jgi:hypothetical protein
MPAKKKPSKKHEVPSMEDTSGHIAETRFNELKAELDDISLTGLEPVKIDMQAAAVQAIGVAELLSRPENREKIAALAEADLCEASLLPRLETVAWATWYTRHKLLLASATHSEATLPDALAGRAQEVRGRMLKTLDYHLDDNPKAMAQLAHIRAGGGHQDLANDLSDLAVMYRAHHEEIRHDRKKFRDTDEREARELSEQILRLIGATTTPEQTRWKNYQVRASRLLFEIYEEAIRVGRFLYFYDDPEGRFPSLFTAVRAAPVPSRAEKKPEAEKQPEAPEPRPEGT